jgi:hypothetical protein
MTSSGFEVVSLRLVVLWVRATGIEEEENLVSIYQLYNAIYSLVFCFQLTRPRKSNVTENISTWSKGKENQEILIQIGEVELVYVNKQPSS